jgi:tRNA-dihydrouridine synthase 2
MTEEEMVEREMGLPIEHVKTYENELDYRNKLVLAPMVRTGSCELSLYA